MKYEMTIDAEKLINEVMENYPEAGAYSCIKCTHYKYSKCEFEFHDTEADVHYKVTMPKLLKGFKILLKMLEDNKLPGLNLNLSNIKDAGEWDANCSDALVQCAIFKDVIYG